MNKTAKALLSALLFSTLAAPCITSPAHAAWGDILDRVLDRQDDKAKQHTKDKDNETADKAVHQILYGSQKDEQPQEQNNDQDVSIKNTYNRSPQNPPEITNSASTCASH